MFIKFDFIVCSTVLLNQLRLPVAISPHKLCQSIAANTPQLEIATNEKETKNQNHIPKTIFSQTEWKKKKKKIKVRKTNANAYAKNKKFNKNAVAGAIIYWPIVRLVNALRSKAHLFLVDLFFLQHQFNRAWACFVWSVSVSVTEEVICTLVSL